MNNKILFAISLGLAVMSQSTLAVTPEVEPIAPVAEMVAQQVETNINTASAAELAENLTGIGPEKADAIVTFREQNGPFKTIADLTQVKGIGEQTLKNNMGKIIL